MSSFGSDKSTDVGLTTSLAWKIGLALFPALVGLALLGDSLQAALEPDASWGVRTSALLYITMAGLGGMWIANASNEEGLLDRVLAPPRSDIPSPYKMALLAAGMSVVIAIQVVTTQWLSVFAVVYSIYAIVDLALWHYRLGLFRDMFDKAACRMQAVDCSESQRETWKESYDALKYFYLERPHLWRVRGVLVVGLLLLSLHFFGYGLESDTRKVAVNIGFIALIVISEIPITIWRVEVSERVHKAGVTARDLLNTNAS